MCLTFSLFRSKLFQRELVDEEGVDNVEPGLDLWIKATLTSLSGTQVKYMTLLCADDEDQEIVKAAAGALAMLTSQSKKICAKIFEVGFSLEQELNRFSHPVK